MAMLNLKNKEKVAVRHFLIRIRKYPAILSNGNLPCLTKAWLQSTSNIAEIFCLKILQLQGNFAAAWQSIWVLTINGDQNFLLWHDRHSPHEALQSQNLPGNCHQVAISYPINKQVNNIRDSFTYHNSQVIPKPSKNGSAHTTEDHQIHHASTWRPYPCCQCERVVTPS